MISKRNGNGHTICVGCKEKNNGTGLHWDNVLYDFNDKPYCIECLLEILDKLDIENTKLRVQCYCSEVMVEVYREMFNNLFKKEISYGK